MDGGLNEPLTAALYPVLMGPAFESLAPTVRSIHARSGRHEYRGEVDVVRGTGLLSRVCAWATRLPPAASGAIRVSIESEAARETWTRHIGGHAMRSRLWAADGLLNEQLGLVRFGFRLQAHGGGVRWRVVRVRALGVPLPVGWFEGVHAHESQRDGRYCFDVSATLPLAGLLVAYRGWLHVQ